MDESSRRVSPRRAEGLLSAISVGVFFLLVGAIFVVHSPPNQINLWDRIVDFLTHFEIRQMNNLGIYLLAPVYPLRYSTIYLAAEQFCFVWGLFQIIILAIRFAVRSSLSKKAEAASSIVFWIGAGFLISNFLLDTRWTEVYGGSTNPALTVWFVFWSTVIMLLGFSLIIRAIVLAVAQKNT